jgi:hypothetical protein
LSCALLRHSMSIELRHRQRAAVLDILGIAHADQR